jgi:KipI family sensor histidine kinase inhibitor
MTRTGFYLGFSEQLDLSANARLLALARALLSDPLPGLTDIVPGYVNVYLEFDADRVSKSQVERWLKQRMQALPSPPDGKQVEIPVRYDGPDLPWVAQQTGLPVEEVVRLHHQPLYRVFATGFTPGFPFLGPLDERLCRPRRSTPRAQVPAHSVAIAGTQTGIYPLPSPGGWHLIGTALTQVYNPHRENVFLLEAGDRVRFVPSQGPTPELPAVRPLLPTEPRYPALRVEQPGLLDLVMDGGRQMAGRFGLAASGVLDTHSAAIANRMVGNPAGTPLLELTLNGPVCSVLSPVVAAFAGYGMTVLVNGQPAPGAQTFALRKGDVLSFEPSAEGVRGYLAIAGGIESRQFWGSASTDVTGLVGRALQAGDVLGLAAPRMPLAGFGFGQQWPLKRRIRLLTGPQYSLEAMQALCRAPFELVSGDRMGLRLSGPEVPGGGLISEATPLGAIQITTQGQPLVLLNDRGRIGGFTKPAIVHPADLPGLAQLRPGQKVRFTMASECLR